MEVGQSNEDTQSIIHLLPRPKKKVPFENKLFLEVHTVVMLESSYSYEQTYFPQW